MDKSHNKLFEYHDLIEAIVSALENRDNHTFHHSKRVSNMTQSICNMLSLDSDICCVYHIAADLHDIGKIGIRDHILFKDGKLSSSEWLEMEQHTIIGESILAKVNSFKEISKIVRHHHECWDGTGYPDGIYGSDIPEGSRVIALADSIDAMLSNRVYRKAMSNVECKNEIQKNIGKMYDPYIAELVLDNWGTIIKSRSE